MSEFPLNLLLQISKAMVNSKIHFFNSEILFLAFGPADPAARSASGPASPLAAPSPRAETVPAGPFSPHVGRVFAENTFSLSDHAFPSRPRLPRLSINRAPPVRFTLFPTPADPGRKFPVPPLPRTAALRLGCLELLQPSLITLPPLSPSNRALTSLNAFNGVKAINSGD
jgi:hypothetical protein